jgi:hypothetical protein
MDYGLWADVIGITHAMFVIFVVGGLALTLAWWALDWKWTQNRVFRFAHLAAIGFVVVQQWLGAWCPLTLWENELRRKEGGAGYEVGFIEYWLNALLYYSAPAWMFTSVYTAFGLTVAAAFVYYPPRNKPPTDDN